MRGRGVLAVVLLGVSVAGCARTAARQSDVAARPACAGPSWTTVPAAFGGGKPVAVIVGQTVRVGVALTEASNAQVEDLRIDVVPASANVQDGAGAGIPVSDGIEPHVARLHVTNPAALSVQVLRFDGRDEQGRPLRPGDYHVYVVTDYRTAVDCGPVPRPSDASPGTVGYRSVAMIGTLSVAGVQPSPAGTSAASLPAQPRGATLCAERLPGQQLLAWADGTVAAFHAYQYGGPTPTRPLASAFAGLPGDTSGAWCAVRAGSDTTRWWAVVEDQAPQRLVDITGPGEGKPRGAVDGPEQVP